MESDMNWELVAWLVIASSVAVICASFFSAKGDVVEVSGKKVVVPNAAPNTTLNLLLEIAWPALFIASLGMLTFKEIMGFAAVLLTATVMTGAIWLIDSLLFKKKRLALNPPGNVAADTANATRDPVLVEMAKSFFPVILIVFFLRSFLYEPFKIPSGSMVPTLLIGDFILVNKYTYGIRLPVINKKIIDVGLPKRADVMVFRYPEDKSKDFIKRVVGLPGDTISYKNKRLTVNGVAIETKANGSYTDTDGGVRFFDIFSEKLGDKPHAMMVDPNYPAMNLGQVREFPMKSNCTYNDTGLTCKVPDGHYFMMGDSRDNSDDGRFWGFVPEDNIVGKAVLVWMNFGSMKRLGTPIE
jgi:signal peptidase I